MTEHYKLVVPPPLLNRLRQWADKAREAGCGPDFLDAIKLMKSKLETQPASWGDPLFHYPIIQGVQCRGMIAKWFLVWYGFHPASRIVYVRDIVPAPGCPVT